MSAPHNTQAGAPADSGAHTTLGAVMETDDGSSTKKCSQTFLVQIGGCLTAMHHMGPDAGTWRPHEGKHAQLFGLVDGAGGAAEGAGGDAALAGDITAATNALRNATITKATLLQCHNSFPVPLGVTVSCLPKKEAVETGDTYTFTTIPNATVTSPQLLYQAGEEQNGAGVWRSQYPMFNAKNLDTQGVLSIANCPYVFVNENHPAINLLRANKNVVGVDIDTVGKMDGEWYKLTRPLMESCCDTIRTKILSRIQSQDLSQLCVQLHRIGGVPWSSADPISVLECYHPDPGLTADQLKEHVKKNTHNFINKPSSFMARIHIEYELPVTKA